MVYAQHVQAGGRRTTHRLVWAGAAICAATVLVAGVLPGFTVSFGAFVGAGDEQQILPSFERTHTLLGYGHPRYLGAVAATLAAIAAAGWGYRRTSSWIALAAILAAALIGLSLTSAVLRASDGPSGGVFLSDAVHEVRAVARNSPQARRPEFELSGYSARSAIGWWLTQGALYAMLALSSFALGRRIRPVGWVALAFVLTSLALLFAVPGENCGGGTELGHDPDSNPLGLLAIFAGLACAGLGLGALSQRGARLFGALAVVAGLVVAFIVAFGLAGKDCAFY